MYIGAQSLSHLPTSDISNRMQRKTVEQFIMVQEIFANTVDNQMEQLMLLVEEKSDGQIANLLLRIFSCRDEVYSLEVPKVDIPAENVDIEQLADVFLLVVTAEVSILELLADIRQLLVDSLLLELAGACVSQVGNELNESAHIRAAAARAAKKAASWSRHGCLV